MLSQCILNGRLLYSHLPLPLPPGFCTPSQVVVRCDACTPGCTHVGICLYYDLQTPICQLRFRHYKDDVLYRHGQMELKSLFMKTLVHNFGIKHSENFENLDLLSSTHHPTPPKKNYASVSFVQKGSLFVSFLWYMWYTHPTPSPPLKHVKKYTWLRACCLCQTDGKRSYKIITEQSKNGVGLYPEASRRPKRSLSYFFKFFLLCL